MCRMASSSVITVLYFVDACFDFLNQVSAPLSWRVSSQCCENLCQENRNTVSIDHNETSPYTDRHQVSMIRGAAPASDQSTLSVVKSTAEACLEASSGNFLSVQWFEIPDMVSDVDAEWQDLDQCHFDFNFALLLSSSYNPIFLFKTSPRRLAKPTPTSVKWLRMGRPMRRRCCKSRPPRRRTTRLVCWSCRRK